jgi:hypothetical protein
MAPQSYQLTMRSGPNEGKTYDLEKSEVRVGRDLSNDIVVNDAEVSRQHARFMAQSGGYVLEDLGSTNGTFVDGQRLMGPHLMRPGELILLGENVSLVYEAKETDPDATIVGGVNIPGRQPAAPREEPTPEPGPFAEVFPAQQEAVSPRLERPVFPDSGDPYSGRVPEGPVESFPIQDEIPARQATRTWIYVGCGCLAVLVCLLVGAAFAFDTMDLYCTTPFSAFFNCP